MIFILSCIGFLAACGFAYISSQLQDDMESQITKISAGMAFFLTFFFSPLLFKLFMVSLLILVWPLIGDRLSLSFYRRFNK